MKQVLFIQGAGAGAYEEDQKLADFLRGELGSSYQLHYPAMPNEDDAPYEEWVEQIERSLAALRGPVVLVGHSVGASVLIKYLTEVEVRNPVIGIFLLASPFWVVMVGGMKAGGNWRFLLCLR